MPRPVACCIHDELLAKFQDLLHEHGRTMLDLSKVEGFPEAEHDARKLRDACVAARQALHDHDSDHGCQVAQFAAGTHG